MVGNLSSFLVAGNATATNSTSVQDWASATVQIIISTVVVFVNGFVLLVLLLDWQHLTHFKVYIVNLLAVNLYAEMVRVPAQLSFDLGWHSTSYCFLAGYGVFLAPALQIHAHLLITSNRVWAVLYPMTYRTHHTIQLATCGVFSVIIYIHAVALPGIALGVRLFGHNPFGLTCFVSMVVRIGWARTVQFLLYIFPLLFIGIGYVFVALRIRRRRLGATTGNSSLASTGPMSTADNVREKSKKHETAGEKSRSFNSLTCITCLVLIAWTPSVAIFTVELCLPVHIPESVLRDTTTMVALAPAADPILFFLSFKDIRDATRRVLSFHGK